MGLFDNLTNKAGNAVQSAGGQNKTVSVTFERLPEKLEEFKALPQAALQNPFDTAALTVLALCFYPQDKELCAKLFIRSGGADNPREVLLRLAKDGKWYLWEQFLLVGIRAPESSNPWAT